MKHEVLLGLTTTPKSDWRGKVEEMKKFGIKRVALFPTFLGVKERKELYGLLEQIEGLEIPHVHLRENDMENWELELFENRYKTQVYNIHQEQYEIEVLKDITHKIFVENRFKFIPKDVVEKFAGICVDFSHMEDGRLRKWSRLDPIWDIIDSYKIGCCHVSAIKKSRWNPINLYFGFDRHSFKNFSDFDYMLKHKQYLPAYISLELENTFEQQLEAKRYLEKILELN